MKNTLIILSNISRESRIFLTILLLIEKYKITATGFGKNLDVFAVLITFDWGCVQKEAFFHQLPCVTLRDEMEWTELVKADRNRLAPPVDAASLQSAITAALGSRGNDVKPYGTGDAAGQIVAWLRKGMGA